MKSSTLQFEVAVRVRLNLEILILILKPQSALFLGMLCSRIRVRVLKPMFDFLFMVRVSFRVMSGYEVKLKVSTAVAIQLQSAMWKFSPTNLDGIPQNKI